MRITHLQIGSCANPNVELRYVAQCSMEHPARSLYNLREMLLRLALELNSSCHVRQSRKSQRFAVAPSLSDFSFWLLLEVLLFSTAELCFQRSATEIATSASTRKMFS